MNAFTDAVPRRAAAWATTLALSLCACGPELEPPLEGADAEAQVEADVATTPRTFLARSDVVLSPRFYDSQWEKPWADFHATSMLWTYAGDTYAPIGAARGFLVGCTVPFWVPPGHPSAEAMKCRDAGGRALGRSIAGATYFQPDVGTAAWRAYALASAKALLDAGCRSLQQDDSNLNVTFGPSGCFSGGARPEPRPVVERYHAWLHEAVQAHATARGYGRITWSTNLTNHQTDSSAWLQRFFDFYVSELWFDTPRPAADLLELVRFTRSSPRVSAISPATSQVRRSRQAIASAYALGATAVVPWNVFVGPDEPRFFGTPAQFEDLFRLVRTQPALFDGYAPSADGLDTLPAVRPGWGVVTAVEREPTRTRVTWSRGRDFPVVPAGQTVFIDGAPLRTTVRSTVGYVYLPAGAAVSVGAALSLAALPPSIVSVTTNVAQPTRKVVHLVSWDDTDRLLSLSLRKADFPVPPAHRLDPKTGALVPVRFTAVGDRYVYADLRVATWLVLAP